ncbi:exodeoxyribonuclease VII large subunit [Clostridium cellulovorans]|uniref:Exodeoxyribonuclease 7 large subunit n=1 Tax=Clostridium cellulovorans (strain ATCC 35296 / DSM 3052 / OCM 3 / 743B) TaxID=573061 RepID=D9SLU7_CLOC7|nr:exodeoxyribonuclease VII large subunit [Clostridium cellulovorans]ADL51678.1 exodeoxyribonuclease VII, large subunit [Clostridium cellulovorans 743B]
MFSKVLTVSELNSYIKRVVDNDYILKNSRIKGEISNLKIHSSGHIYFSLKDEDSKISAVMFRSYGENISFQPQNGMNVEVKGRVSVYIKDGAYQIYIEEMKIDGLGDLNKAYEELKAKLLREGLFDDTYKKPLPINPISIAVVTSPTGAAIRDIINVISRRNPYVDIKIFPTLVQGIHAAANIESAIKAANNESSTELIILARGGGSIEELWAFNEEVVAYAIHNSKKPIITGIGHETDFTIADFASDKRASTPSAAAEIAVTSFVEIDDKLNYYKHKLYSAIKRNFEMEKSRTNILASKLKQYNPVAYIANQYTFIDGYKVRLNKAIENNLKFQKNRLVYLNSMLNANNPLGIISKGYSILRNEDGKVISTKVALAEEKKVEVILQDGSTFINIGVGEEHGK